MGCYDSVNFTCPQCGERWEEQSKSGDCHLEHFRPEAVPPEVVPGLDKVVYCPKCKRKYKVTSNIPKTVSLILVPEYR